VKSVDVIEVAIPGFGNHGQRPPVAFRIGLAALNFPGYYGIADHTYAVRVCDHDGAVEKAGILEPSGSGHLAVAVEREPAAKDGIVPILPARKNGGDTSADGAFADYEFAASRNECGVPDFHATDVGDGVIGARRAFERNTEVAGAGFGLGEGHCAAAHERTKNGGQNSIPNVSRKQGHCCCKRKGSKSHHRLVAEV
jgi:hypothetical protein